MLCLTYLINTQITAVLSSKVRIHFFYRIFTTYTNHSLVDQNTEYEKFAQEIYQELTNNTRGITTDVKHVVKLLVY